MKRILLSLITSILSLSAVASVDPASAYREAKSGKAVIIDVREAEELAPGMVEGAKWFPLSKVKTDPKWKAEFLKLAQDKKIYLYCRSGNRSGQVQEILRKDGIKSDNLGGFQTLKALLPVSIPAKE